MKKKILCCGILSILGLMMICSTSVFADEEKQTSGCVAACIQQKNACYNIQADKRICEVGYQDCVATCDKKKQEDAPSPAQQKPEKSVN